MCNRIQDIVIFTHIIILNNIILKQHIILLLPFNKASHTIIALSIIGIERIAEFVQLIIYDKWYSYSKLLIDR